jgi:hypothetical protein
VQHPGTSKPSPMTCAEFEASFDQYVDETLDAAMMNSCSCHIASCRNCDREVTRWQQTRILLSTAVADFSTAVDVSSLRSDVFAALGFAEDTTDKRQSATREAAYDRGASVSTRRSAGRPARRAGSGERRNTFGAVLRFASAATVSAIAAAAAVMVISPGPQGASTPTRQIASMGSTVSPATIVANNAVRPSGAGVRPAWLARAVRRNSLAAQAVAPVAYTRPPLAKPEVSHVDALEAGQGQRVATWVQDSTGARVIWVENGGPVRRAGLSR